MAEPGIPAEDVRPVVVETDSVGFTAVTGGSRTTFATGWAAYEAAQDVVRQMKERAAKIWETDAASVEVAGGVFRSGDRTLAFKELAERLADAGGPPSGTGFRGKRSTLRRGHQWGVVYCCYEMAIDGSDCSVGDVPGANGEEALSRRAESVAR